MKTPHKHAELIKAWADGAEIEFFENVCHAWLDCTNNKPAWDEFTAYRIKTKKKPDVITYYYVNMDKELARWSCLHTSNADLRIIVDGETGKLKSAEVI